MPTLGKRINMRLSRLLRTDAHYLLRGGGWITLTVALRGMLGIITQIAFANFVSKEIYGGYRYIAAVVASCSSLSLTGMSTAVTTSTAAGRADVLMPSVKLQLKWNVLMALAVFCVGLYYLRDLQTEYALSLFLLALIAPLAQAFSTYRASLMGLEYFREIALAQGFLSALSTASILLIIFCAPNLFNLSVIPACVVLAGTFYLLLRTRRLESERRTSAEPDQNTAGFGVKLSAVNFVSVLSQQLDKVVLLHFGGAASVATLAMASVIPDNLRGFLKSVTETVLPKLSAKSALQSRSTLRLRIVQAFLAGAALSLTLVLGLPLLFRFIFPKYLEAVQLGQLLSLDLACSFPLIYMGYLMRAQRLLGLTLRVSLIFNLLKVLLFVGLGAYLHTLGMVLSKIIATLVAFAAAYAGLRAELERVPNPQ